MISQKPVSLDLKIRGMGVSATLAIKARCRQLRRDGRSIYDLGLGQSPFPVPDCVVEALRLAASEKDYLPVRGLRELRGAVADFHRRHDEIDTSPRGVIIGPGSKELMFLVQLAYYGEIIVEAPCWVSYMPQARIIGRRVSVISTTFEQRWKITSEQLAGTLDTANDRFRPRLLVLNYPGNPSGLSYTADELEQLAEVARAYETIILSDEIYGQLHHQGAHVSIARFYPEGTIVSSGLSKWCGAGGWRLGTFCFPADLDWLLDAMAAIASETYTTVSAPIQYAAVQAFRGGAEIERYLSHARRILTALGTQCAGILREAGIRVHQPDGAFYLLIDFTALAESMRARGIRTSHALCDRILEETGAAILPGAAFALPDDQLCARLAYVDFDGARALAASEHIALHESLPADFTRQWCGAVIEGVTRIAEWATSPPGAAPQA